MFGHCRSVDVFEKLNPIGEGTYGRVFKARDKTTGEVVALKKVHLHKSQVGFPATALREIGILLTIDHPNIVKLKEVVLGPTQREEHLSRSGRLHANEISRSLEKSIKHQNEQNTNDDTTDRYDDLNNIDTPKSSVVTYLVFEYCDHDLASLVDHSSTSFSRAEIKCILQYLLRGLEALHLHHIIHRDIKLPNIFLTNKGELKLGDFGLARLFSTPAEPLTSDVVTVWYRAPELLFGLTTYTEAIDLWGIGCVMGELLLNKPLLPGKDEEDQVKLICNLIGTPTSQIWPSVESLPAYKKFIFPNNPYNNLPLEFPTESPSCLDLLSRLLICDPNKRITAREALCHPYFSEHPLPKNPSAMPTWKEHRNEFVSFDISSPSKKRPLPNQKKQVQGVGNEAVVAREWMKVIKSKRKSGLFSF